MSRFMKDGSAALCAEASTDTITSVTGFSAHPLFCASCLRIALWRGEADLALRCAMTLSVFDPTLLWKTLTLSVLEDHGAEAASLLPLALAAAHAAKRLGAVWPVAAILVPRVAEAPKSRFYLLAARCLTHGYCSPSDAGKAGEWAYGNVEQSSASQRIFEAYWAPRTGYLGAFPCSLNSELQRLSKYRSWDCLDLAEAAWRGTRAPSALAFAALECGPSNVCDPNDCPTVEVALNHKTPRGRLWIGSLPTVPPQITSLPDNLRTDSFGEVLARVETESCPNHFDSLEHGQLCALSGLSVSNALEITRHIRANLPYFQQNRRSYLGTFANGKVAHDPQI